MVTLGSVTAVIRYSQCSKLRVEPPSTALSLLPKRNEWSTPNFLPYPVISPHSSPGSNAGLIRCALLHRQAVPPGLWSCVCQVWVSLPLSNPQHWQALLQLGVSVPFYLQCKYVHTYNVSMYNVQSSHQFFTFELYLQFYAGCQDGGSDEFRKIYILHINSGWVLLNMAVTLILTGNVSKWRVVIWKLNLSCWCAPWIVHTGEMPDKIAIIWKTLWHVERVSSPKLQVVSSPNIILTFPQTLCNKCGYVTTGGPAHARCPKKCKVCDVPCYEEGTFCSQLCQVRQHYFWYKYKDFFFISYVYKRRQINIHDTRCIWYWSQWWCCNISP